MALFQIQERIPSDGVDSDVTRDATERALRACATETHVVTSSRFYPLYASCVMLTSAILWTYWNNIVSHVDAV